MKQYIWLIFLAILVFLLLNNADRVKQVVGSISSAQTAGIIALQGGNPGAYVNS